jgi:hypothetical protein
LQRARAPVISELACPFAGKDYFKLRAARFLALGEGKKMGEKYF